MPRTFVFAAPAPPRHHDGQRDSGGSTKHATNHFIEPAIHPRPPPLPAPLDANVGALAQVEDATKPIGWHLGLLALLFLGGCCLIVFLARRRGTRASTHRGGGRTAHMPEIAIGAYPLGGNEKVRQPNRVKWQPSPDRYAVPSGYPPPNLEKQGSSYEDAIGNAMLDALSDGRNGAAASHECRRGSLIEGL